MEQRVSTLASMMQGATVIEQEDTGTPPRAIMQASSIDEAIAVASASIDTAPVTQTISGLIPAKETTNGITPAQTLAPETQQPQAPTATAIAGENAAAEPGTIPAGTLPNKNYNVGDKFADSGKWWKVLAIAEDGRSLDAESSDGLKKTLPIAERKLNTWEMSRKDFIAQQNDLASRGMAGYHANVGVGKPYATLDDLYNGFIDHAIELRNVNLLEHGIPDHVWEDYSSYIIDKSGGAEYKKAEKIESPSKGWSNAEQEAVSQLLDSLNSNEIKDVSIRFNDSNVTAKEYMAGIQEIRNETNRKHDSQKVSESAAAYRGLPDDGAGGSVGSSVPHTYESETGEVQEKSANASQLAHPETQQNPTTTPAQAGVSVSGDTKSILAQHYDTLSKAAPSVENVVGKPAMSRSAYAKLLTIAAEAAKTGQGKAITFKAYASNFKKSHPAIRAALMGIHDTLMAGKQEARPEAPATKTEADKALRKELIAKARAFGHKNAVFINIHELEALIARHEQDSQVDSVPEEITLTDAEQATYDAALNEANILLGDDAVNDALERFGKEHAGDDVAMMRALTKYFEGENNAAKSKGSATPATGQQAEGNKETGATPGAKGNAAQGAKVAKRKNKKRVSTLLTAILDMGGLTTSRKNDVAGVGKGFAPGGYNQIFSKDSKNTIEGLIGKGGLDDYLPPELRFSTRDNPDAPPPDMNEAADYLKDKIRGGERVIPYDAQVELDSRDIAAQYLIDTEEEYNYDELNAELQIASNEEREVAINAAIFNPVNEDGGAERNAGTEAGEGFALTGQTNAEINDQIAAQAAQERIQQAEDDAAKAEQERAAAKARAAQNLNTVVSDNFVLGQSKEEVKRMAQSGVVDMFGASHPAAESKPSQAAQAEQPEISDSEYNTLIARAEKENALVQGSMRRAKFIEGVNDGVYGNPQKRTKADAYREGYAWGVKNNPAKAEQPASGEGAKIEDFGEKIIGARKEYAAAYKDKMADAKKMDVLAQPLSKSWPEPDYQKLIDAGASPRIVGLIRSVRDEIPNKPGKSYRQATWAKQVELLRDTADRLLNDKEFADKYQAEFKKVEHLKLDDAINGRAELYELLGHEKSLKGIRISRGQYAVYNGVPYNPPKVIWEVTKDAKATAFGNMPRTLGMGDSRQAAIDSFAKAYPTLDTSKEKDSKTKFELYANRYAKAGDKGQYFIGKKVGRNVLHIKDGFDTVKEARAYMADHNDELTAILEKKKEIPNERYDINQPRVGQNHRMLVPKLRSVVQGIIDRGNVAADSMSDILITHSGGSKLPSFFDVPLESVPNPGGTDNVNASLNKLPAYRLSVFSKFLGNLNNTAPLSVEGYSSLDIPGKRLVQSAMLAIGQNKKIRDRIIELIPVDVMNNLIGTKFSADGLFGDQSMLSDGLAISGEMSVRSADPAVLAFINAVAGVTAKTPIALDVSRVALKNDPAVKTGEFDGIFSELSFGGHDVTPQDFQDAFSFFGVQFGNYVSNERRQQDLNNAYDALMDLAAVLDIPPKALSLNGELGLAFGARGTGGKNPHSAHYESGQVVINLTKGSGAGSLAHEWWHSLDNYFSRLRGKKDGYATDGLDVSLAARGADYHFKDDGIRKEMIEAFGAVVRAVNSTAMRQRSSSLDNRRTKEYWGTGIEMSARAFERYVIAKLHDNGFANDYLANVVSEEYWNAADALGIGEGGSYPYPTEAELPAIRAGFDKFFQTIETKETDKGVALLSLSPRMNAGAVDFSTADAVVRRVVAAKKGWNVEIRTFATFDALPSGVKEATIKDYGEQDAKKAKGIVHNGKVYIVAENNESEADVESTVLHEVEGHVGIHRLYGKEIIQKLNTLYLAIGGRNGLKKIVKQRGIQDEIGGYALALHENERLTDEQKTSVLMDEVLAHYAQHPKFGDRVKAIVGAIRQWLRDNGFAKLAEYGETDLLHILKQGRAQLKTAGTGDNATSLMVAWHGSPHDHDKFDSSKIGTGEGAQAYGHGLYFAGNKEVAEWYRHALTNKGFKYRRGDGTTFIAGQERDASELAATATLDTGNVKDAIDALNARKNLSASPAEYSKAIRMIEAGSALPKVTSDKGRLYQVELAPKEDEYLLWDKPLSEQSERVKAALESLKDKFGAHIAKAMTSGTAEESGKNFYDDVVRMVSGQRKASEYLHSIGIRGIKYLDGSSRDAGEGNYNYVIFSDEDVSIKAKFSQSTTPSRNPHTLATITVAIDDAMGQGFAKLLEATGKFKLIESGDIGNYLGEGARFSYYSGMVNDRVPGDNLTNKDAMPGSEDNSTQLKGAHIYDQRIVNKDGSLAIENPFNYDDNQKEFFANQLKKLSEYPITKTWEDSEVDNVVQSLLDDTTESFLGEYPRKTIGRVNSQARENTVNAIVRAAKKDGWRVKRNKNGSAYLEKEIEGEDITLRVSTHDLPLSDVRLHNRKQGLNGNWDDEIIVDDFKTKSIDDYLFYLNNGHYPKKESNEPIAPNSNGADIRYSKDGRILAFVKAGHTYLVADNISRTDDNVKGLLLHEIGAHALTLGRNEAEFQSIIKQFTLMGKMGNQKVKDAQARVPKDTPAHLVDEEALGYYLEKNSDTTFAQKFFAWFRAAIRKIGTSIKGADRFKFFQWANNLTLDDITYMAQQALKSAPSSLQNARDRGTFKAENESQASIARSLLEEFVVDNDAVFKNPVSASKTLEGSLRDIADAEYKGEQTREDERSESGADHRYVFTTPTGKIFYVYETDSGKVWIDVSNLDPGTGGQAVYDSVANYAYNTHKVFAGDPNGLSRDAIIRRTSNMLSSALRFGTTRHLEASKEQISGDKENGIEPLNWSGSDIDKVEALIHTFVATSERIAPQLREYGYNFQSERFTDGQGRPVTGATISANLPRAARIGEATARRAVFLKALMDSQGKGVWGRSGILEKFLRWRDSASTPSNLNLLFSKSAAQQSIPESAANPAKNQGQYGKLDAEQSAAITRVVGQPKTLIERAKEFSKDWKKNLVQGIVDQYAPIKEYSMSAYIKARMSKGSASTLEAIFMYGKPRIDENGDITGDFDASKNGGKNGFASVLEKLDGEHDRFLLWVAALRADRLKGIGLENLWSDADIKTLKTLNQGKLQNGKSREAAYVEALKGLNEYNDAVLKIAVERGLINDATRKMYQDTPYVPFYRLSEEDVVPGFAASAGMVNQTAWKKLKGGTQKLNEDLLANMLQNWSHLIEASARNDAARATLTAAVKLGAATEVPNGYPGKGTVSFRDNVMRTIPKGKEYEENGVTKVSDGTAQIEEGVERTFLVSDPHLMDAISSIGNTLRVHKVLKQFKHVLTMSVTANPAFKVRNLIRDSAQSMALADISYNPAKNIARGAELTKFNSETRAKMLFGGGIIRFGSMLDGNSANMARELVNNGVPHDHILDNDSKIKGLWDHYIKPAFDAYQEIGDRGEQINRAALFDILTKPVSEGGKGMTQGEANFWARDLMDFSMSGKWTAIRFLTQTVPFMNARLQGLYKLGRSAKADKKRFGIVVGGVAMTSLMLLAAYGDDDDWKKREDWDRDNFWWFKVGGHAFRIPKPFEIGAIGTIAERGAELMFDDEMTGRRFRERMRNIVSQQLSMNPTPQLVKPLIDLWANKDSFSGRNIETMGMSHLKPEDRISQNTSGVAKLLGQLGMPNPAQLMMGNYEGLSPVQIDFLIKGYFSWLGVVSTTVMDHGLFNHLGDKGETPDRPLRDMFFVGNFVESLPSSSSLYVSQLYNQADEIEQAYNSY